MGKVEARELYLYTTGTEPFKSTVEATEPRFVNTLKEIILDARGTYCKDYCTKGEDCFSDDDVEMAWRKILGEKVSAIKNTLTMTDVEFYNSAIGEFWFDYDAMKAWDSSVESELFPNMCFVTRERTSDLYRRCHAFSVRRFNPLTCGIETIEFQTFGARSKMAAIRYAREYKGEENE